MKTKVKVTYEAMVRVRWSHTVVVVVDDPEPTESHFDIARRVHNEAERRSRRCGKPALPKRDRKVGAWAVASTSNPRWCEMQEVEDD